MIRNVVENSKLYSNVFPSHILEALQTDVGEDIANQHNSVSVLMADIVGFTKWCAGVSPVTIIQCLSAYFQILDDIAETLGVYKVETIGDGYQAICGAPLPNDDHAAVLARFALKIIETVPHMRQIFNEPAFDVRVGINSGPIVTGVIRADRPRWQLFGDTVNYASRMESTSEPGRVQVSRLTHDLLLLSNEFEMEKRGWLDIKGRGLQETFFLKSYKGVDIHSDTYLSSGLDTMLSPTPSGSLSADDSMYVNSGDSAEPEEGGGSGGSDSGKDRRGNGSSSQRRRSDGERGGNGKPSVFLVDDMLSILLQYKRVLQKANISVSTARDGMEALDVMKNQYFTVVFCDITMPKMDGVACIKAFREWEREAQRERRQIVYALTGTASEQRDEYLAAGFDSVISKNNSKKILLKYVFDATQLSGETMSTPGMTEDDDKDSSQHTTDDENNES